MEGGSKQTNTTAKTAENAKNNKNDNKKGQAVEQDWGSANNIFGAQESSSSNNNSKVSLAWYASIEKSFFSLA